MCGATAALLMQKLSDPKSADGAVDDASAPSSALTSAVTARTEAPYGLRCLGQARLVPVGRDHPASGRHERADHGPPDAARRAGDNGYVVEKS